MTKRVVKWSMNKGTPPSCSELSEMHSRVRLKIPPFDRLRVVSEVEPPEAGVRSNRVVTIIAEMYDGTDL